MLNPSPKNALVSPRVHHGIDSAGLPSGGSTGGSAGVSVTSVDMAMSSQTLERGLLLSFWSAGMTAALTTSESATT